MTKENLYKPFEIAYKELDRFPRTGRSNNYFELIYIVEGTGVQSVNRNKFHYRKGNLFLLTPQDRYSFEISTTTQFFFCDFMSIILPLNR